MITQRASLLIFVAFCFYLIAVVNSLPGFFYGLTWLSLGLLASSLGIALLSLAGLSCLPRVGRARGHAGWRSLGVDETESSDNSEAATLELSLHNAGSFNKIGVVLEILLRDLGSDDLVAHRFLLETLTAGQSLDATLALEQLPRGLHRVEGARLIGSDVLGLFRVSRRLRVFDEVPPDARVLTVGTPLVSARASERESGFGRALAGRSRQLRVGPGDEVRGTRPYLPGDDLRHVHWKSTARAGELMMREWEHAGRAAALVVWDGIALGENGRASQRNARSNPLRGEIALSLAASLSAMLRRSDLPFALALLGENRFFAPPTPNERGDNDAPLGDSFLTAFAEARAGRVELLDAAFDVASGGAAPHFDLVWIITTRLYDNLSSFVEQLGAQAHVRIVFVDESPNAGEEPIRLAGAFVEHVAVSRQTDWLLALERALERLQNDAPRV